LRYFFVGKETHKGGDTMAHVITFHRRVGAHPLPAVAIHCLEDAALVVVGGAMTALLLGLGVIFAALGGVVALGAVLIAVAVGTSGALIERRVEAKHGTMLSSPMHRHAHVA
jgi:hypothetical protein